MENFLLFSINIIFVWALWVFFWKPTILKFHVTYITALFDDICKCYSEQDRSKIELLTEIYNKAANTPRDMDIVEFSIILDDISSGEVNDIYSNEDERVLVFADACAKSMYMCLRMRSVRYFTSDFLTLVLMGIKFGFKDLTKNKVARVIESSGNDTPSPKIFFAHS